MAITDWPLQERPRERLLTYGAATLSDAELLAIFLRTGVRGKTAVDLARELVSHFGGLRGLLDSSQDDFCQQYGLGVAKFAQLQAVLEMSRRHLYETVQKNNNIENPDDVRNYLTSHLRHYQHEVFACLFLDNRHRVISFEEITHGTLNSAHVHPREVVKRALHKNAAAVILAHNHPSGVTEPSRADRELTQQMKKALELVDVRLLDHIIVGEGPCASLAEMGWI
jgi:DNA repair protein RadC